MKNYALYLTIVKFKSTIFYINIKKFSFYVTTNCSTISLNNRLIQHKNDVMPNLYLTQYFDK